MVLSYTLRQTGSCHIVEGDSKDNTESLVLRDGKDLESRSHEELSVYDR